MMRDYESALKQARTCANRKYCDIGGNCEYYDAGVCCQGCEKDILNDAADAIEELVAMRNVLKSRLAQLEKAEYESGDCAETYKSGFLVGKRQGAIELLREILGIDVDDPPKEENKR